jgi:hypothetical protein
LSAAVSRGGNGASALTAFDNLDTAMIDGHRQALDGDRLKKNLMSRQIFRRKCGAA